MDWTLKDSQKSEWLISLCSPVWSSGWSRMDTPVGMGLVVGGGVSGEMDWIMEDSQMSEWLLCLSTVHPSLVFWQEADRQTCGVGVRESHVDCGGMSGDWTLGERQETDWLICTNSLLFSSPAC